MHKQRIAMLICAALGMLGTFLPWVEIPVFGSADGTGIDGWITFSLYATALSVIVRGESSEQVDGSPFMTAVLAGVIACGMGIWDIAEIKNAMATVDAENPFGEALGGMIQIGIGLYIVSGAGIVMGVLGMVLRDRYEPARTETEFDPMTPQQAMSRVDPVMTDNDVGQRSTTPPKTHV